MRDDLSPLNIGVPKKTYDIGFFNRALRDIETWMGKILSRGPIRVSSVEADSITVAGQPVVTEAPMDGNRYVRKNGAWEILP